MVLLEVLTALFIFTMVAFSLIMALDAAMSASRNRNDIEAAMVGLQNQMALLEGSRVQPLDQDLPDDGSGILYHLKIEPEEMMDQKKHPVPGMLRATITAKWLNGLQAEDRSISFLVYQP